MTKFKLLPRWWLGIAWSILALALATEFILLLSLVVSETGYLPTPVWLLLHLLASALTALSGATILAMLSRKATLTGTINAIVEPPKQTKLPVLYLFFALSLCVPFAGALGGSIALIAGIHIAASRHRGEVYWQFTENAALPFTTPVGRAVEIDSRSLTEQVNFSADSDTLYKKILAAGRIKSSLSVGTLKQAVRHQDERIRLTAYQTLDKKTSQLNLAIQQLEKEAATREGQDQSNTWLQIASNYWELLTLEKDEPVAREQLLNKAAEAAIKAISILPSNRNAHFTLGRISLLQNNPQRALVAFRQAIALGMPREKAIPYLAEAAFDLREFATVSRLLQSVDPAFTAYPPLSHVARYWA